MFITISDAMNNNSLTIFCILYFVMKHIKLTIVASVEQAKPWTQNRLDELEGRLQKNLMTMDYNMGINIRDEVKRKRRKVGD